MYIANKKMKLTIYIVIITVLFSCDYKMKSDKSENLRSSFNQNHKVKVMVLGIFHFKDAGLDTYKPKFPFDILEEERQNELNQLIEKIAIYNPTKILLERKRVKYDSLTDAEYRQYLAGKFDMDKHPNEDYQIGFKLAKKLKHEKVYCSDAKADWFGVELDWDNYDEEAYMKSKGQFKKTNRHDYHSLAILADSLKSVQPLVEHLFWRNKPENRLKDHQQYLNYVVEGAGDNYLGADNLGRWYRRNLRIFSNVVDIADFDNKERLLLIYGSGHVWQLRQFFKDSPDFEYVEPNEYLK